MQDLQALATDAAESLGAAGLIIAMVIVCTRVVGLRSFSKMSSFDFAMTIAMGSVVASGIMGPEPKVIPALLALFSLFLVQFLIALSRRRPAAQKIIDNEPTLLMLEGEMLRQNMDRCRVTEDDLRAKLREANVLRRCEIRAVVLETTGDVSVLHGAPTSEGGAELEDWLLQAVQHG